MFPSFEQVVPSLRNDIEEIQQVRKKAKRKMYRNIMISLVLWAAFIVSLLFNQSSTVAGILLAIAFFGMCILIGLTLRGIFEFRHTYKGKLVNGVLTAIFKNIIPPKDEENFEYYVRYRPSREISHSDILKSRLVGNYNRKVGEDYTSGKIGLTTFKFSELNLKREETYRDKDGKEKKRIVKVFTGIVFIADFHKDFMGQTFLVRNKLLGKDKWRLRMDGIFTIDMEDMAFNKAFQTMTTNDIEARYILSSNLMRKIMEFNARANGPVKISFIDSKMFIFTESKKNHFEGSFFSSNDEKTLREIYTDFMLYFDIIEEFRLNRRIWNKR